MLNTHTLILKNKSANLVSKVKWVVMKVYAFDFANVSQIIMAMAVPSSTEVDLLKLILTRTNVLDKVRSSTYLQSSSMMIKDRSVIVFRM